MKIKLRWDDGGRVRKPSGVTVEFVFWSWLGRVRVWFGLVPCDATTKHGAGMSLSARVRAWGA